MIAAEQIEGSESNYCVHLFLPVSVELSAVISRAWVGVSGPLGYMGTSSAC